MDEFNETFTFLKNYNYKFVDRNLKEFVNLVLKKQYNKLILNEIDILFNFTIYLIEDLSIRIFNLNFDNESVTTRIINKKYYDQWKQNNGQDILAICSLLLPFVNYTDFSNLNQISLNTEKKK